MPGSIEKKLRAKRGSLDAIWHLVLAKLQDEPKITNAKLWTLFGAQTNYKTRETFVNALEERDIVEFRKTVNKKVDTKAASKELTKVFTKTFEQERKEKGILFLQDMDVMVKKSATVIGNQIDFIAKQENPIMQASLLPDHMDNLNKLTKIGKEVYALDKEMSLEDQQKYQLNVLMNFNPLDAMRKAKSQSTEKVIDI